MVNTATTELNAFSTCQSYSNSSNGGDNVERCNAGELSDLNRPRSYQDGRDGAKTVRPVLAYE